MSQILSITQATMPIDVAAAKEHLRSHDDDDLWLERLIRAATEMCQQYAWRLFTPAIVVEQFDRHENVRLAYYASSVTEVEVTYTDMSTEVLVEGTHYRIDAHDDVTYLCPLQAYSGEVASKQVTYDTGYVTTPEDINVAVLLTLTDFYENRMDRARTMPTTSQLIMNPYRRCQFQ